MPIPIPFKAQRVTFGLKIASTSIALLELFGSFRIEATSVSQEITNLRLEKGQWSLLLSHWRALCTGLFSHLLPPLQCAVWVGCLSAVWGRGHYWNLVTRANKIKFITVLASMFAARGGRLDERSPFGPGCRYDIRLDVFHLCGLWNFCLFPLMLHWKGCLIV